MIFGDTQGVGEQAFRACRHPCITNLPQEGPLIASDLTRYIVQVIYYVQVNNKDSDSPE